MIGRASWVGWETQPGLYGTNVNHINEKWQCPAPPTDAVLGVPDVRPPSSEPQDTRCSSSESQDPTRWSNATSVSTKPRPAFFTVRIDGAPEARTQETSRESTPRRRPSKDDNPAYNACCVNKSPARPTTSGAGVVVLTRHEGEPLPHVMSLPGKTMRRRMSI